MKPHEHKKILTTSNLHCRDSLWNCFRNDAMRNMLVYFIRYLASMQSQPSLQRLQAKILGECIAVLVTVVVQPLRYINSLAFTAFINVL
jgi:hypothetical protein